MEEVVIPKDINVEDYFRKLPYTKKDRLHRYRKVEQRDPNDKYYRILKEDTRKGKVINNRCYRNLDAGSWELFAVKLPNDDIITTDKKYAKALKKKALLIDMKGDWENEKELERVEKLCRKGEVGSIQDYKVLMKI